VEEAHARRAECDAAATDGKEAIHKKLIDAESRRMALLEEAKAKAMTPVKQAKGQDALQRREQEAVETSLKLKEKQALADQRRAAVIAESKEKGAAVARKAASVGNQQRNSAWQQREELAQGIQNKLKEAENRREAASREGSRASSSPASTPAKSSSPHSPKVPMNTPVAVQTSETSV